MDNDFVAWEYVPTNISQNMKEKIENKWEMLSICWIISTWMRLS